MIINPPKKSGLNLQSKTVTPSTSQQIVTPDNNYDGLNQVVVNGDSNLISALIVDNYINNNDFFICNPFFKMNYISKN